MSFLISILTAIAGFFRMLAERRRQEQLDAARMAERQRIQLEQQRAELEAIQKAVKVEAKVHEAARDPDRLADLAERMRKYQRP